MEEEIAMTGWIRLAITATVVVLSLGAVACSSGSDSATATPVGNERPGSIEGSVTGPDGKPIGELRVFIVGGTAPFAEIASETNDTGLYQIAGVPPGTFQVAVHDRQGERIGVESIDVRSGETSRLNFSISTDATGGDGNDLVSGPVGGVGPGISIGEALTSNLTGPLLINGLLHAQNDQARLCETLAESFPPQCAGRFLVVEGLDLMTMDGLRSEGSVTWSDQPVQVLGTVEDEVLTVAGTVR